MDTHREVLTATPLALAPTYNLAWSRSRGGETAASMGTNDLSARSRRRVTGTIVEGPNTAEDGLKPRAQKQVGLVSAFQLRGV